MRIATTPRPLFFSHIPKNGGVLIRSFLANEFLTEQVCTIDQWHELLTAPVEQLATYRLIQGHLQFAATQLLPPTDELSFFREPVERTLSLLLHLRRDPAFHELHLRAKGKSISEMLADPVIVASLYNHQTSYLSAQLDVEYARRELHSDARPFDIANYLSSADLSVALQRLQQLAFVGLTEQIDESLARLCAQYGFHPSRSHARRNNSSQAEQALIAQLSQRDREILVNVNALDLELFDAVRGLFYRGADAPPYSWLVKHSLARRAPPSGQIDLAEPLLGSNWYEPERFDDGRSYRWSGPQSCSTLELPASEQGSVQLRLFPLPGNTLQQSLSVTLDGLPIEVPAGDDAGHVTIELALERTEACLRLGYHQIVFQHDNASPRPVNGDQRQLQFGLDHLQFQDAQHRMDHGNDEQDQTLGNLKQKNAQLQIALEETIRMLSQQQAVITLLKQQWSALRSN